MVSRLKPVPPDFWDKWHDQPPGDARLRAVDPRDHRPESRRPRRERRAARAVVRFLIALGIGVAGTLGWQSYGDAAREMIAAAYPQVGWLAPQTPTPPAVAPSAPATIGSAAPPAAAPDAQQLKAVWLAVAGVRNSVEQLAAKVAAGQQQAADEIAKLQASEQDILGRLSAPPPRPASPPARKPAPLALAPAIPSASAR